MSKGLFLTVSSFLDLAFTIIVIGLLAPVISELLPCIVREWRKKKHE